MNKETLNLTKKDKIVLINQFRILSKLYPEEESHYSELIQILENGYSIFYSMLERWIDDEMPIEHGKFVLDVLDLYRAIEDTKRKYKNNNLSGHHYSYFNGFDGNQEGEYFSFANFLINTQGKYTEQKDYLLRNDNLNSHFPMKEKYSRMLKKWLELGRNYSLTPEQVIEILDA